MRAAIEGIAAQVALLAQAAGADLGRPLDAPPRRRRAHPVAHLLLQAQADLLQAPVEVYPSPDATALGVAAFARLGRPAGAQLDRRVPDVAARAVVEPQIGADEAAERLAVVAGCGGGRRCACDRTARGRSADVRRRRRRRRRRRCRVARLLAHHGCGSC